MHTVKILIGSAIAFVVAVGFTAAAQRSDATGASAVSKLSTVLAELSRALLGEIDDDFDIRRPGFERLGPAIERNPPRDQPIKPFRGGARKRLRRHLIMHAIGVDGAEYGVVVEHQGAVDEPDIDLELASGLEIGGHVQRLADARPLRPADAVKPNSVEQIISS